MNNSLVVDKAGQYDFNPSLSHLHSCLGDRIFSPLGTLAFYVSIILEDLKTLFFSKRSAFPVVLLKGLNEGCLVHFRGLA